MRIINNIVIHCTATDPHVTVEAIQRYWKEQKGWKSPGYHYIISANGGIKQLAEEKDITNGVAGHNNDSIHISYIGGVDASGNPEDTRTPEQKLAMRRLVYTMKVRYSKARILGHRDFPKVAKACPSFDVKKWLEKENI